MKDVPFYGLKEYASVDENHRFILAATMTPAYANDTNYLPYCIVRVKASKLNNRLKKWYPFTGVKRSA